MFPLAGGGYVESFRGGGCGIGVDHAVRRDDRGLGAAVFAALKRMNASPDRQTGEGIITVRHGRSRRLVGSICVLDHCDRCPRVNGGAFLADL